MVGLINRTVNFNADSFCEVNPDMQFEDYLEDLRRDKKFEHRGNPNARKDLSTELGVGYKRIDLYTDDKETLISALKPEPDSGASLPAGTARQQDLCLIMTAVSRLPWSERQIKTASISGTML